MSAPSGQGNAPQQGGTYQRPIPMPCRIVRYTLNSENVRLINQRRHDSAGHAHGNSVTAGDQFPMIIVKAWGGDPDAAVNGHVFLDGTDTLWVTSVKVGEGPGFYEWPHGAK